MAKVTVDVSYRFTRCKICAELTVLQKSKNTLADGFVKLGCTHMLKDLLMKAIKEKISARKKTAAKKRKV